jgi:serine/threonine protein kinase
MGKPKPPAESALSAAEEAPPSPAADPDAGQTAPAHPGDWTPGQALLDDFVVDRVLGEGGMGKVYLLRSLSSRSRFAVKRSKGLTEADRRRFLAELQTWIVSPQ